MTFAQTITALKDSAYRVIKKDLGATSSQQILPAKAYERQDRRYIKTTDRAAVCRAVGGKRRNFCYLSNDNWQENRSWERQRRDRLIFRRCLVRRQRIQPGREERIPI